MAAQRDKTEAASQMTTRNPLSQDGTPTQLQHPIDLALVVDLADTRSKQAVATGLTAVVEQLHGRFGEHLRVGFIGFRDYRSQHEVRGRFETIALTENFGQLCSSVTSILGAPSRDTPSDVSGALEACRALAWRRSECTRIAIVITQAPCHGQRFHEGLDGDSFLDDFPAGDPGGLDPESIMEQMAKDAVHVYFDSGSEGTASRTGRMISILRAAYTKVANNPSKSGTVELWPALGTGSVLGFASAIVEVVSRAARLDGRTPRKHASLPTPAQLTNIAANSGEAEGTLL